MRRVLFCVLFIFTTVNFVFPHSPGTVKGRVLDDEGNPLANVKVEVLDSPIHTQTETNGVFVLENVKKRQLLVMFTHPDYVTRTVQWDLEKRAGQVFEIVLNAKNPILMTVKIFCTVLPKATPT